MKKIISLIAVVALMFSVMPVAKAEDLYGTMVEDSGWDTSKIVNQTYYVTKTNASGYVYMKLIPTTNIANIKVASPASAFEVVYQNENADGTVNVLLKTKDGQAINGTKTELMYVMADFTGDVTDPDVKCELDYAPLSTSCAVIGNSYYNKDGKPVTKSEYDQVCSNVTPSEPDEPNVETGSVIPYVAIAGGLIAIAGVYLYSRKSSKMFKI